MGDLFYRAGHTHAISQNSTPPCQERTRCHDVSFSSLEICTPVVLQRGAYISGSVGFTPAEAIIEVEHGPLENHFRNSKQVGNNTSMN